MERGWRIGAGISAVVLAVAGVGAYLWLTAPTSEHAVAASVTRNGVVLFGRF